ncbi:hypothetical protein SORDD27_01449 [Streptococcus oralis]|uniref:Uncharacterized protein n=1 Tax=Streptococcus oralis TaxID=1303 RepID=A0A139PVB4_STROR|nr:hypothetical protein SORDD27_01449 [Streptococcus oralis]
MWKPLRACAGCVSSCWGYLGHCWGISRSYRGAILIHTFDCDWIWVSDKLFVWRESYSPVWCNRVSSLTWNSLLFASIFEGWLNCFIDWNQWVATLEGWSTCLRNTLRACACCASSCRSYLSELWAVSRSHWSAILIYAFDCNWIWVSDKLFVWSESYSSVWCNRVSSLVWNRFLFASIFEGWLYCFINWNQWVSTLEGWCARLWNTLRTCAGCTSSCWCYFFHHRLVLDSNRSSVGIHTSQFKFRCFTLELFVWGEGYLAFCVHFKLTNIWYFLHSCTVVK